MSQHPYEGQGNRQVRFPKVLTLADIASAGTGTAQFRIPMPDSRLRVAVSLVYDVVPNANAYPPDITGVSHTIWMGLESIVLDSRRAGPIPTSNVIINPTTGAFVTRAAPLAIPSDAGVLGFSREFVTGGDQIFGELKTGFVAANPGRWLLYTRYQPDGLYLPPDEWDEVKGMCTPQIVQAAVVGGGNS